MTVGRPSSVLCFSSPSLASLLPLCSLFVFTVLSDCTTAFIVQPSLTQRGQPPIRCVQPYGDRCTKKNSIAASRRNVFVTRSQASSLQEKTSSTQAGSAFSQFSISELTEDAPDVEGNTILGHWSEDEGSIRWSLVEPNLAELKKEMRDITDTCERLQNKLSALFAKRLLEGKQEEGAVEQELGTLQPRKGKSLEDLIGASALQELSYEEWKDALGFPGSLASRSLFDSLDTNRNGKLSRDELTDAQRWSKVLVGLHTKREVLASTIEQYEPSNHHPECIAKGGQGMILVGKDLTNGERVAIKVERVRHNGGTAEGAEVESALEREFNVLYALKGDDCFPSILHFGRQFLNTPPEPSDCRVMVMDLLGTSISDLWWDTTRGSRGFEPATSVRLAVQMLELLKKVHDKGFIHRDIKPANFVMSGHGDKRWKRTQKQRGSGHLCLIDFGIAAPFTNEKEQSTESAGCSSLWGKKFFGTVLYASLGAHDGEQQSYRDDLESLLYVFAWMMNGGLPWGGCADPDRVMVMKRSAVESLIAGECKVERKDGKELCNTVRGPACPCTVAIRELAMYCRTLDFGERPDYDRCRAMLMTAYSAVTGRDRIPDNEEWEWNKPQKPLAKPLDFMDLV